MDYSADFGSESKSTSQVTEQRGAPRFTSLIRSAKLVCGQGEFLCVIRDVSATGISLRAFHGIPANQAISLELQNGESYQLKEIRRSGFEASFQFDRPVAVDRLIHETWNFPKRQLRLNIAIPLTLSSLTNQAEAETINISQQGARVSCDTGFALDQRIRVSSPDFPETRATVRWRKDGHYGLVFDNTFSLREFALLAAAVQCPAMLQEDSDAA